MDCTDRESLGCLYERVGRAAILKTARLVGRLDVAEEIVQSTFLKLLVAGLSFPDDRAAYAWVYRTCHNAGIDHLRAHATRFERDVPAAYLGAQGADAGAASHVVERQWLLARLALLTEREAQVLAYRFLDDMTQHEIAEVMGVSRKSIVRWCAEIDRKFGAELPLTDREDP